LDPYRTYLPALSTHVHPYVLAGIVLRYRAPEIKREYKLPGGNLGMWIASLLGILGAIFAISIGFFPPQELDVGSVLFFEGFLIAGLFVFCAIPFIIYAMRTEAWLRPQEK
jgi:glutamate:GABA antiporter